MGILDGGLKHRRMRLKQKTGRMPWISMRVRAPADTNDATAKRNIGVAVSEKIVLV